VNTWLELVRTPIFEASRTFKDKTLLFERDAPAARAFVLTQGAVEILHREQVGTSLVTKILIAPSMFGAIEAISAQPSYLESVRVLGTCTASAIRQEALVAALRTHPAAALEVLEDVSGAFCVAARMERSLLQTTEVRLANLLVGYMRAFGSRRDAEVVLKFRRTQADFAEAIGAGERSVNRLLSDWQEEGLMTKRRGRYVIHRPEALRRIGAPLADSLVHTASSARTPSRKRRAVDLLR
jgi:CRP-like cAMP-binding protein